MQNPAAPHHRAQEQNSFSSPILLPPSALPQYPEQLSLFTAPAPTGAVPIPPCLKCGETQGKHIPGKGPHYAGLKCANCERFIQWLAKPKSGGAT